MCLRFSALGVMPRRTSWLINALNNRTSKIVSGQQQVSDRVGGTQTLLRMELWIGRIKLDCADTAQGGGKKQPPFYSDMPCSHIFPKKSFTNFVLF